MKNDQLVCIHVLITGKVQGVGYRYSTVQQATKLGLKGWVRNLVDGRVESIFEGHQQSVEQMVQWCHQGPSSARVTSVSVETLKPQSWEKFEMRSTFDIPLCSHEN